MWLGSLLKICFYYFSFCGYACDRTVGVGDTGDSRAQQRVLDLVSSLLSTALINPSKSNVEWRGFIAPYNLQPIKVGAADRPEAETTRNAAYWLALVLGSPSTAFLTVTVPRDRTTHCERPTPTP